MMKKKMKATVPAWIVQGVLSLIRGFLECRGFARIRRQMLGGDYDLPSFRQCPSEQAGATDRMRYDPHIFTIRGLCSGLRAPSILESSVTYSSAPNPLQPLLNPRSPTIWSLDLSQRLRSYSWASPVGPDMLRLFKVVW